MVKGTINYAADPHQGKESLAIARAVALAATTFDLLLDPFGLDLGLWEWKGGGPYASEVKGPNGKRGIPLLNFVGWLAMTSGVTLAYQRLESGGNIAEPPDSEEGSGQGSERVAAVLLLSYYPPAALWARKRGKRRYLLYSAPLPR